MDVLDAINLLKKYQMYDDAESECRRKKIDKAPYDMQGHHEVYCHYLSKKWVELRDKRDNLLKVKCVEWNNIPDNMKSSHYDCYFVGVCCSKDYCKTKCNYYRDNIAELEHELEELSEAQKVLREAAKRDFGLR